MSESSKRVVFIDENNGKVECQSKQCDWTGDDDYLYNHYKENHNEELMTSDDNILSWTYLTNEEIQNKTFLAWISDTMFWIHTKIEDELYHVALQYAVCGNFIYNIRIESNEKIGVGILDQYKVAEKILTSAECFEKEHFTMKISILKNMCKETTEPKFMLSLSEDQAINNTITEFCGMYLEDDTYKYECLTDVPYECVTFAEDDFKCNVCLDESVHVSKLTMCDSGHSICLNCKMSVDVCPVHCCESPYSSEYKNPAVEMALKLFGWEGIPYE